MNLMHRIMLRFALVMLLLGSFLSARLPTLTGLSTAYLQGALPTLNISDVTFAEGNSGTTIFTFVVSLSAPAGPSGVTFDIATANNTASTADGDYVGASLTGQTIPAGSSTYAFNVMVNGDTNVEGNETFFVNVTNITGATVGDAQGTGTIINDDVAPAGITVNPTSGLITTEAGGEDTFTVVLDSQPSADVSIDLSSSDLTEGTVSPSSLVFTAANWNIPQTVTITGVDDAIVDGDIAYTVIMSSATSVDLNYDGTAVADVSVTNTDDDEPSAPPATPRPQRVVSTPVPPPPTPGCDAFNYVPASVLRATIANGLGHDVFCRMIYESGAPSPAVGDPIIAAATIGVIEVLNAGVVHAVDIYSPSGLNNRFDGGGTFCLQGQGTLVFLAASGIPRVPQVVPTHVLDAYPGYLCATLHEVGTLVLVANPL